MQVAEAEILQFDLEAIDTQAVGDRRIDIQRFARDALSLAAWHRVERLHVVQAIGELDEDDPNVADHRQHHLAEALGLGLGAGTKLDLIELADAVHQQRDFVAELFLDLLESGVGVFDRIVQDCRHDRLGVEVHFGKGLRYGDRVGNIGLAGLAGLPFVCRRTELVSARDRVDLLLGQVCLQRVYEIPHAMVALRRARQFRQYGGGVIHTPIIPAKSRG